MNCRNCGAAMELIAARRYSFCRHCGSFHFPETLDEGIQVIGRDSGTAPCGICKRPLATAVLDDRFEARYCESCRGVLLGRARFVEIIDARRAVATTPAVPAAPIDPRELERSIRCPGCSSTMSTHPYYGPGNVVIDTCDRCDVVWLDFRELTQIADAPGSDRGPGARLRHDNVREERDVLQMLANRFGRPGRTEKRS
jgi:Zn-finger nucleic acid-binding protein